MSLRDTYEYIFIILFDNDIIHNPVILIPDRDIFLILGHRGIWTWFFNKPG